MTLFWIACALLIVLAAAFVAVPLMRASRRADTGPARAALNAEVYRDQLQELDRELADGVLSAEQHLIAREELDRRALTETAIDTGIDTAPAAALAAQVAGDGNSVAPTASKRDRWLAPGVLALIPVVAIATYLAIGTPAALTPPDQQFARMVEGLAQRMAVQPDDVEGWVMLGRAYQLTGRMPEAADAFGKASALKPDSPDLMASHADALAMVQGSLAGKPIELVVKALRLDPANRTALALAATAAMENRQFDDSIMLWQRLATLVEPGSRDSTAIDEAIEQVRQVAKLNGVELAQQPAPAAATKGSASSGASGTAAQAAVPAPAPGKSAAPQASISGEVLLAPELARQAKPDEVLFIFARAIDGPPLPLAVLRATVKDLPLRFTLDDSMAMAPGARLSMYETVIISARISRSGQAMPQPGDLTGSVQRVPVGATGLQVRIDEVVR